MVTSVASALTSPEEHINQNAAATLLLSEVAALFPFFFSAANISCAALSESHARQGLGQDDIRCWRVSRLRIQLYGSKGKGELPLRASLSPFPLYIVLCTFYDNARQAELRRGHSLALIV